MGFFSGIVKAVTGAVKSVGKVVKSVALPALGAASALVPGIAPVLGAISSIGRGGQVVAEAVQSQGGVGQALANLGNRANEVEAGGSLLKTLLPVAAIGVGFMMFAGGNGRR